MAPKGLVFAPFWSEIGYGFRGSHGSVWTYLSFPFQMSKKEREICEYGMHFLEVFFCCCSNLSNDDIISKRSGLKMGMDFRRQVWKRVWKMTFIYRTWWHTPTKNSQEYPWGCGRVTVFLSATYSLDWSSVQYKSITKIRISGPVTYQRQRRLCRTKHTKTIKTDPKRPGGWVPTVTWLKSGVYP